MKKGKIVEIYRSAIQRQSAAVKTIFLEIKVPPQSHKIVSESSKPTAAMCGNSFASALLLLLTISLRAFGAHNDMLIGFRFNVNVGDNTKPKTAFAFSAHSEEKKILI